MEESGNVRLIYLNVCYCEGKEKEGGGRCSYIIASFIHEEKKNYIRLAVNTWPNMNEGK